MSIDTLLAQHMRILAAVEALEAIARAPRPARIDGLSRSRWQFTRDLMLHLGTMEASVYTPLRDDPRAGAPEAAEQASGDAARLAKAFRRHAHRWRGFPAPERWDAYCAALVALMQRIRMALDAEARILTRFPPVAQNEARTSPRNGYASDAWEIRDLIYDRDRKPIE